MQSVKDKLLEFLQINSGVHHGGALQRLEIRTRRNGLATGDCLKRRLNELVKEGKIHVDYNSKHEALFSATPIPPKKVQHVEFVERDGVRVAQISYL